MLVRQLYTLFFYLALPFIFARLKWRARRLPDYNQGWSERLGRGNVGQPPLKESLWVQATSIGETQAAVPLITALQKNYPGLPIVVTHTTPTGLLTAKQLLGDTVIHRYFPLDVPYAIDAFINHFNPKLAMMMETEIWPNLLHNCHQRSIPVLLANARLSEYSMKRYLYIKKSMKEVLSNITLIAAQTQADAERFTALGADPKRLIVAGNLKCNVRLPENLMSQAHAFETQLLGASEHKRPVFTIASIHYDEMTMVLEACAQIKKAHPTVLFLLVPRKPEDFDKIALLCERHGFSVARYSRTTSDQYHATVDLFLGDVIGKLFLFYAISDLVFVAGSLTPDIGGHSLIEPALLACPIITGGYTKNWTGIVNSLKEAEALQVVDGAHALAETALTLLQDAPLRKQLGSRAKQVMDQQTQALEIHVAWTTKLIGDS